MKASEIYFKTMKFSWMKLGLGALTIVASCILLAVCLLIGSVFEAGGVFFMFCIWLAGTRIINLIIMHYFGYMVKAGHVAIITEAVTKGVIPENQFETAKEIVAQRFATSNVYFIVDKLVSGAVKQIQRVVEKTGSMLNFIPGMSNIVSILNMFIGIALGYIDECCLGYVFYQKDQGAFKSSMDGVVVYFQNWKKLLKDAAVTVLTVLISVTVSTIVVFLLIGGIFTALELSKLFAFILAVLIAVIIKSAFIDSWILVKMMSSYMEVAPSTEITFDLYGKLCGFSSKFKELFNKAKEENPSIAYASSGSMPASIYDTPVSPPVHSKYCGNCGAEISGQGNFCESCGASVIVKV